VALAWAAAAAAAVPAAAAAAILTTQRTDGEAPGTFPGSQRRSRGETGKCYLGSPRIPSAVSGGDKPPGTGRRRGARVWRGMSRDRLGGGGGGGPPLTSTGDWRPALGRLAAGPSGVQCVLYTRALVFTTGSYKPAGPYCD